MTPVDDTSGLEVEEGTSPPLSLLVEREDLLEIGNTDVLTSACVFVDDAVVRISLVAAVCDSKTCLVRDSVEADFRDPDADEFSLDPKLAARKSRRPRFATSGRLDLAGSFTDPSTGVDLLYED